MGGLLDHAAAIATTVVATGVIVGGLWRFVILPNLREQLFKPVRETHKQVTENGGTNDPPTLPDKLHALQDSIDNLTERDSLHEQNAATLAAKVERDAAHLAARLALSNAALAEKVADVATALNEHLRHHEEKSA